MQISKYIHSCLLIEESGKTIIIDPGIYSYEVKALDINSLEALDYILITHEHADHFHLPFVKELKAKFPSVQIITNSSVQKLLNEDQIESTTAGNEFIKVENFAHEKVFGVTPPENVLFRIFDTLTHPGDSVHFTLTTPVLTLPVQAPWGNTSEIVEFAMKLKPKIIIPVHDWHWREEARKGMYSRFVDYFKTADIEFIPAETGKVYTV